MTSAYAFLVRWTPTDFPCTCKKLLLIRLSLAREQSLRFRGRLVESWLLAPPFEPVGMQLDQAVLRLLSSKATAPRQHRLGKHPRAMNDSNTLCPYLRPPPTSRRSTAAGRRSLSRKISSPGILGKLRRTFRRRSWSWVFRVPSLLPYRRLWL